MQIPATITAAKAPPMAIPAIAPPAKRCVEGVDGLPRPPDATAADFDIVVEDVVRLGIAVQNPFHESAHSCSKPAGIESVKDLLCGTVLVFGPGAWARNHSLSPVAAKLTPTKAACIKARPRV